MHWGQAVRILGLEPLLAKIVDYNFGSVCVSFYELPLRISRRRVQRTLWLFEAARGNQCLKTAVDRVYNTGALITLTT